MSHDIPAPLDLIIAPCTITQTLSDTQLPNHFTQQLYIYITKPCLIKSYQLYLLSINICQHSQTHNLNTLQILEHIHGFSSNTLDLIIPPSLFLTTMIQHTPISDPITCLTWNYGHISTNLYDIFQLTNIHSLVI
jgi:hypothetical protein